MTETHYLADILILLGAAVVAVLVFQRLGLGLVPGYLVAGAVVGRWGLGLIEQIVEIRHIAVLGTMGVFVDEAVALTNPLSTEYYK